MGHIMHYYCYNGYRLEGNFTRTCHDTLDWSGNPPTCLKESESESRYISEQPNMYGCEGYCAMLYTAHAAMIP